MAKSTTIQPRTTRLPSTRESRPAMIGLAVLLIVGGALASVWLAVQSGNRASFLQVSGEVAQGARIDDGDLTTVSLPENFKGGVPASRRDDIVGQSATTRLLAGTVLGPDMVSKGSGVEANQTQLTIPVPDSPFIQRLQPGAPLALAVGASDSGGARSVFAELVSVGQNESGGGLGGSTNDDVPMVVSIDLTCLTVVAQGIADDSVTPALVGSEQAESATKTCGS